MKATSARAVQQLVKNGVPLCGTNWIHGACKSAIVFWGCLTAVRLFRPLIITSNKDGKQPPDRTRPGPERIRYGSRKLEAVRTSCSSVGVARSGYPKTTSHGGAPQSTDKRIYTAIIRRRGCWASRLRDPGACWSRLPKSVSYVVRAKDYVDSGGHTLSDAVSVALAYALPVI
jgi:hypothetical protein